MKRDPYKTEENWNFWKEKNFKGIKGIRKVDSALLIEFLKDMELGLNTTKNYKGKRSPGTLLNLASHNVFFAKISKKSFLKLTKKDLHNLENEISQGKILKKNNEQFISFGNYIKDFKVFWHWLQRTGKVQEDITEDISTKTDKPAWVYLTEEQAKNFFNKLIFDYRVLAWFMYDSGMRVTEAHSIQIKHFAKDFKQVTIPDEASKTFGRTIELKLCSELLKEYVKTYNLQPEDFLIKKKLPAINKYLKENCEKMFDPDEKGLVSNPKSKGKYCNFTLYDIRHNSSCFWLNRYPTHKGLMYRFGWKRADKIDYYSGFLGVKDEIMDVDMVLAEDKTKLIKLEQAYEELKANSISKELVEEMVKQRDEEIMQKIRQQFERQINKDKGRKINDAIEVFN